MTSRKKVLLVILDGWGNRAEVSDNAVALAATPHFSRLKTAFPVAELSASGSDVGLPDGQFGNSEVGHLNIGAGRVVMQDLPRIDSAVDADTLKDAPAFRALVSALRASGGVCHLLGLISPGGVHSHSRHAVALARALHREGIKVVLHVFTDGRDTPPRSAADYVADLERDISGIATIGSVCGRFFAMDRDNRWERVEAAYRTLVSASGTRRPTALAAVKSNYDNNILDEFIEPSPIGDYAGMKNGDGLLFFNFRADRMRELVAAFADPNFKAFAVDRALRLAAPIVTMTSYSAALAATVQCLFERQSMANGLGEVVALAGRKQMRMAETEKYPHVTYFFNGGQEKEFAGEARILVPSPKVKTYDLAPEMSARPLTEKALEVIRAGEHDLIVLNFANPDMVGHTGDLAAAIKAVEVVDECLGKLIDAAAATDAAVLVIADHGNCEVMRDPITGEPHTAHTTNLVPVILVDKAAKRIANGRLADVAPTILRLLGLPQPVEMTGTALFD